jgi:hypothetical protein
MNADHVRLALGTKELFFLIPKEGIDSEVADLLQVLDQARRVGPPVPAIDTS